MDSTAANDASASQPRINVVIQVLEDAKAKNDPKELVRKVTQEHEVVEVDGFVFRRKRKTPPAEQVVTAEDNRSVSLSIHEDVPPGERGVDGAQDEQPCTSADPGAFSEQAVLQLCQRVCESQLQVASSAGMSTESAAAASGVVQRFVDTLRDTLSRGTLEYMQASSFSQAPNSLAGAEVLASQLLEKKARLQKQLLRLQQEEATWTQLLEQDGVVIGAVPTGAAEDGTEADPEPPQVDAVVAEQGVLKQSQAECLADLSFQVEGLCALVKGVEELLRKADRSCRQMQEEYHTEKFRSFAHVDSPNLLIREVMKLSKSTTA